MTETPETPPKSANGWTEERRAAQREAIKNWQPWNRSTGPRTADGKARSARNAFKHGFRSREWHILRALLRHQRSLHGLAERRARQKPTNELLDDPLMQGYNRVLDKGRMVIESMIMGRLCFSGLPDI